MAFEERSNGSPRYLTTTSMSRRSLLRRAAWLGLSAPLLGSLLAACGGSSSSPTTSVAPQSTGTSSAAGTPATSGSATPSAATPGTAPVASPSAQATASATPYTIEPAKHTGGKIVWGSAGDASTINPVVATDAASGSIIAQVFEGLTRPDPVTTNTVGLLAKSWEISQDGLTYTFTLQDNVKWHDGQPFSADDAKFTYDLEMNKDTKSPSTSTLVERVKSVDVPDSAHVVFTLTKPNAAFLASNTGDGIVPKHILRNVAPAQIAQHAFSTGKKGVTIGTGPFMFEEWVKDDHVIEVKNPNYWQGQVALDQWIFKVVPSATVLVQQLKTGEVDYADIQPSDVADMQKEPDVRVHASNSFSFVGNFYNLDPAKTTLFQDKEVRQALLYALDRKAMVDAVFFGLAAVAVGTMPVLSWAYDPGAITDTYPYDVEKAKSLLDSAGWKPGPDGIRVKNGTKLAFDFWTTTYRQPWVELTEICQESWKKIGVQCTPRSEEINAFLNRITSTHDYELMLVSFGWGADPDQTSMWSCAGYKGGFNLNKYCNPQVDKLLADGLATTDHAKRIQIYNQMQNIIMDDLPTALLFFPQRVAGVNKRVHNLFPNVVDVSFNTYQWWVDA